MTAMHNSLVLAALWALALALPGAQANAAENHGLIQPQGQVHQKSPETPATKGSKTIIVGEFQLASDALRLEGAPSGVEDLLLNLRLQFESRLVEAGRFVVMPREVLIPKGQVEKQPGDMHPRPEPGLPALKPPIDYRVTCRIERLSIRRKSEVVKLTGYVSRSRSAQVAMSLTLTDGESGAIRWTVPYTQTYEWSPEDLRDEIPEIADGALGHELLLEASEVLARELLREVFPAEVVTIDSAGAGGITFYLNAGSALYSVGDKFELILRGKALLDPDSGELLGHVEQALGVLRIVRQDHKASQAQLIEPTKAQEEWIASEAFDRKRLECRPLPRG